MHKRATLTRIIVPVITQKSLLLTVKEKLLIQKKLNGKVKMLNDYK
jgi:hypothetical protein